MNTTTLRLLTVGMLALVLAVGCAAVHGPAESVERLPPTTCSDSLELAWAQRQTNQVFGLVTLRSLPGGALLHRGEAMFGRGDFLRTRDGQAFSDGAIMVASGDWRYMATLGEGGVISVRDVLSGSEPTNLSAPTPPTSDADWYVRTHAVFAHDGRSVMALDCWQRSSSGEDVAVTRAIELATTAVETMPLGIGCGLAWGPEPILVASGDSRSFHAVGLAEHAVARVSFDEHAVTLRRFGEVATGELIGLAHIGAPDGDHVSATVSPDGNVLALVRADGMLSMLDATTLETIGEPTRVGLAIQSGDSYLPRIASPVAFSPDGASIAHVGIDGRVSVRSLDDEADVTMLDGPFGEMDEWGGWPNSPNALLFEDNALTVSFDAGVARFECGAAAIAPGEGSLAVTLRGPSMAQVGDITTFEVTVPSAEALVLRWLELDGVQFGGAELSGPDLTTYVYGAPGGHMLRAGADDGVRHGVSASTPFVIRE